MSSKLLLIARLVVLAIDTFWPGLVPRHLPSGAATPPPSAGGGPFPAGSNESPGRQTAPHLGQRTAPGEGAVPVESSGGAGSRTPVLCDIGAGISERIRQIVSERRTLSAGGPSS